MASSDPKDAASAALTPQSSGAGPASPSPAPPAGPGFLPGAVFAGRYRMVAPVGRGGMGEVWRADDLVLNTPVALKLVRSASADTRARLLREVRLARQITHPGVCRVFDAGEAEGQVFYSMELVEGEDLATLLRRAGRLVPERVVDLGRQLCAAVAAAHDQGVLHRDLKPANILIDAEGSIRITDFGIAIARADGTPHTLIGTPGYMAPEQRTKGAPLSERTDVFAIGRILYELLVGRRPSDAAETPPSPSALVAGADAALDRVILKALAPDARQRWSSAREMGTALSASDRTARGDDTGQGRRRRTLLSWPAGPALAVLAALVALGSVGTVLVLRPSILGRRQASVLTDQDTIVLADFVNSTGEPVFDGTLKVALAVALEQSPFLKVFSDDAVRDTLRLMEREPNATVTRAIARDIARREGLKALVAGSISAIGSHYVIALEAIGAETGDVMAREQVEAASKEQVLASLGRATSQLRQKLGESLPSLQKFDTSLARATTASLDALHAYSQALDDGRVVIRKESIPALRRAIEVDPDFALAHALLSGIYANTGQTDEAPPHARRAFELRDRVSERERYFISWRYYVDALQSWSRALELAAEWTRSYPREAFAFNSLGLAAGAIGQHARAEEAFREARRLDPRFVPPHRNLAGTLMWLGRFDEAMAVIGEARAAGIVSTGLRQIEFLSAFALGDQARLAAVWRDAATPDEQMFAVNSRARAALFGGRVKESHGLYGESIRRAEQARLPELAAGWTLEDGEAQALVGQCAAATPEVTGGLARARNNFSLERASRLLALCGDDRGASALLAELTARSADATLTTRIHLPVTTAILALTRGRPEQAKSTLEAVRQYDFAATGELWPPYVRGEVLLALKDAAGAAAEFRNVIAHRGVAPASPLYALAHLGLARAESAAGNAGGARAAYQAFLTLWKDADADLRATAEARAELARLP